MSDFRYWPSADISFAPLNDMAHDPKWTLLHGLYFITNVSGVTLPLRPDQLPFILCRLLLTACQKAAFIEFTLMFFPSLSRRR